MQRVRLFAARERRIGIAATMIALFLVAIIALGHAPPPLSAARPP